MLKKVKFFFFFLKKGLEGKSAKTDASGLCLPTGDHFTLLQDTYDAPVLLPGKSHERRSLVGCSPWSRKESDTTERLHFHFSLSCFGEGNGNPCQCSCLENSRDRGAW